MANPRKFSEKIALLKQKEAEEKGNYERILREVRAVTHHTGQLPMPQQNGQMPQMRNPHVHPLLDRIQNQTGGNGIGPRNSLWSSMPNIHSAAHNQMPPSMSYYNNGSQQMSNFHQMPPAAYPPPVMASNVAPLHSQEVSQPSPMQNYPPQSNSMFLEPPGNWQMNGVNSQPGHNYGLLRATSDSALHHTVNQKIDQINQERTEQTQQQPPQQQQPQPLINRRLRPPQLTTPQGAPCGSLPDLTTLTIPKNNSRPSSAKPDSGRRLDSPGAIRQRDSTGSSSTAIASPRNPRRPHPYGNNRMSWNMPGSSPGSPVSISTLGGNRLNSSSLPSSPQTPRTDQDSVSDSNYPQGQPNTLHKMTDCLQPTSPVPNIVFTPSTENDYSMETHPLQMNNFGVPGFVDSNSRLEQAAASLSDAFNSPPNQHDFLNENFLNEITPSPPLDIPLIPPTQYQLDLMQNGNEKSQSLSSILNDMNN